MKIGDMEFFDTINLLNTSRKLEDLTFELDEDEYAGILKAMILDYAEVNKKNPIDITATLAADLLVTIKEGDVISNAAILAANVMAEIKE